jgi:hypothetical protein
MSDPNTSNTLPGDTLPGDTPYSDTPYSDTPYSDTPYSDTSSQDSIPDSISGSAPDFSSPNYTAPDSVIFDKNLTPEEQENKKLSIGTQYNFIIIFITNLLNYFINIDSFSLIINIIYNDIAKLNSLPMDKAKPTSLFLQQKLIEIKNNISTNNNSDYVSQYMSFIKDPKLVSDINPENYTDKLYEQKITSIENFDEINRNLKLISPTIELKNNIVELTETSVINSTKNLFNINAINKIIENISSSNMKVIFDMNNSSAASLFGNIYKLSEISYIYFRLYPLLLYILFAEGVYGVRDVNIRIYMLKEFQFQIRSILNNLKDKLILEKLENTEIPIPSWDQYGKPLQNIFTQKKTLKVFIDDFLKKTIVPNKIIDLFKINFIIHSFGITTEDEIEYFTQNKNKNNNNNIVKKVQKREINKKYFMICVIILITILFFKFFIYK